MAFKGRMCRGNLRSKKFLHQVLTLSRVFNPDEDTIAFRGLAELFVLVSDAKMVVVYNTSAAPNLAVVMFKPCRPCNRVGVYQFGMRVCVILIARLFKE